MTGSHRAQGVCASPQRGPPVLQVSSHASLVGAQARQEYGRVVDAMGRRLRAAQYNGSYFDRAAGAAGRLCTPEGWFSCQVSCAPFAPEPPGLCPACPPMEGGGRPPWAPASAPSLGGKDGPQALGLRLSKGCWAPRAPAGVRTAREPASRTRSQAALLLVGASLLMRRADRVVPAEFSPWHEGRAAFLRVGWSEEGVRSLWKQAPVPWGAL